MYEASFLQHCERIEELRSEDLNELCAKTLELILLDQLVEVGREQFEDEAQVIFVDERISQPENVVLVVRIALLVQLSPHSVDERG